MPEIGLNLVPKLLRTFGRSGSAQGIGPYRVNLTPWNYGATAVVAKLYAELDPELAVSET